MAKFSLKYKTLFFPDKEGTKETGYKPDGKLRIRVRYSDKVVNFNLGYRVELAKWEPDAQRCISGTSHGAKKLSAKGINSEIQKAEDAISDMFKAYELRKLIPTADMVRADFNSKMDRSTKVLKAEKSFFDYFDEFVAQKGQENNWKRPTYQKFNAVRSHLKAYDEQLTFEKLTETGLNNYIIFLRDKKDMRNSTLLKQLAFLKWFLKWATGRGHNTNLAYSTFNPKMSKVERKVIFLNWSELMTVYNFDFNKTDEPLTPDNIKALERVRDVFCFCCFTSLRYSDVQNLKRSDIKNDEFTITTVKTSDALTIELNNYSRAILQKYADEVYPGNKALPVISNQKMNDHLKDLGRICGLVEPIAQTYYKGSTRIDEVYPKYELLGTHAGRRTFICNALALGIAPQTVMKWTGHADYKSMKPYIDIADAEKKKAMNLFNR
jgi:integrase